MPGRSKDTLLLVGDENSCRKELGELFADTYNLLEAENAAQATMLLKQNHSCIVLALMDLPTPSRKEMKELMAATLVGTKDEVPTVAILSADDSAQREDNAFLMGAADVIRKPFSLTSVQRRIQTLVDLYLHKWNMELLLEEQNDAIRKSHQAMVDSLSAIIEHRSSESGNHSLRIRRFTMILLSEVARCCPEYGLTDPIIHKIASASALHDIGKISIPDAILNKPGPLTAEEFETMKTHTTIGGQLVETLKGMSDMEYLRYAYNIALYHHERWDGRGYPRGLSGDDIPICAQVVGITDVYDALTTDRVYKPAYSDQDAVNMILNGKCGVFSPKLLECFKHVQGAFSELAHQYSDTQSLNSNLIRDPLPGPVWAQGPQASFQLFQKKYQALLHYINDTVLELDLDHQSYHVVYNPDPEMDSFLPTGSISSIGTAFRNAVVYPEDQHIPDELYRFLQEDFFRLNLRRHTFFFRIFSPAYGDWQRFQVTLLRIASDNANQRIVTVIFHRMQDLSAKNPPRRGTLLSSPALYGLVSSALRCYPDPELTIDVGIADLTSLVKYSEQEILDSFEGKLLRLILPEDREAFRSVMENALSVGGRAEAEFRLLCKGEKPIWALAKARAYTDESGSELLYLAIRDNSQSKALQEQMLSDIERSQMLIDQSGSIVFDWDLQSDTMYCSPKWVEHFGYEPVSSNYSSQMGIATHFHPDDLPVLREYIAQLQSGDAGTITTEVRIAATEGRYLWTKITATARPDENGIPVRIVGILQDIDDLKRAALTLKEQAQRDALTKLLNKSSTQDLCSDYLAIRSADSYAGMLVVDLDNFKSINDSYGHLYGDVVLAQVGAALRKLFRMHDIVGRIGGDEFLILLKDIPNIGLLKDRCSLLLNTIQALLTELTPDLQVSCSIGAALAPQHGTTYNELFRCADEAMYAAKGQGKNRWHLFNDSEKFTSMQPFSSHTRIDSDDPTAVTIASYERFVFRCLYESRDLPTTINQLLAFVGINFNVSRVYIFENNEDNTACSNTFEWCNTGITPQIDMLQDVSYITDIPGWPAVYDEHGVFYCTDISQLAPQFRAILEPQGIKSMLQCAMMDGGVFRGYIGFDECNSNRLWTKEQLDRLNFLAEAMSVFLLRQRALDQSTSQGNPICSV